jgi:hypothetical protein
MIAALMGNEMTAPLGTQMQFQDIQNRQETERLLAVERAKQAGKPPTIHEFYDGQGRTGMSQWNARTQSWEPVGGVKADAPRNVQTITTDAGVFVLNPDGSTGRRLGGAPQSQARETWSAPVPVMIDGKPAMVQYSNTGNYRVVPDAAPYDAPGTAAKTPEQIREEAKARAQGTAEGTPEQARETWNAPVNETRNGKPVRVQYSNMGNYRVVPDAAPYDAPGTAAKTPEQIREEAKARAEGTAAGTRERFTVNVGSNEVTYTGDPTDQSTWQKVGEAPRFPPSQGRNVQTVTTGNGVFVVNPDGSLGQRLGDAPGATAKTPEEIREEAMARAQGTAAGTPPKPQTPLEVLETRLGQMALDGELNTPEGKAALLNYQLFNGGKTLDQMRDEARVQAEGRAMGAAPVEPPGMNAVNVRMPDGSLVSGRETAQGEIEVRDSNGIWVLAPTEATRVGLSVQASSAGDLALDPKEKRELRTEIRNSEANLEEISAALDALAATPNATGVRGVLIENLGGFVGQLPLLGPEIAKSWGTAEVQGVRTQLQSIIGRFVGTITGDESGRYSDKDMQMAAAAAPAMLPRASYEQVEKALKTLYDIESRSLARNKGALGATPGSAAPSVGAAEIPTDPAQRVVGQVYMTPRGPATWSGTGWVLQNGGN